MLDFTTRTWSKFVEWMLLLKVNLRTSNWTTQTFGFFSLFSFLTSLYDLFFKKRMFEPQQSVDERILIQVQMGSDELLQMSKFFLSYPLVEFRVAGLVFNSMFCWISFFPLIFLHFFFCFERK
jgi:hypothetical protein